VFKSLAGQATTAWLDDFFTRSIAGQHDEISGANRMLFINFLEFSYHSAIDSFAWMTILFLLAALFRLILINLRSVYAHRH
jgi:hypothetical protein